VATDDAHRAIMAAADRIAAGGESEPVPARDPVNQPMIRHWTDALGDHNPVYTDEALAAGSVHGGVVAPPAMLQVWTMPGLARDLPGGASPLSEMLDVLDVYGFTSVIATNADQTYQRYLRPGELASTTVRLDSVRGPKRTAMGEGYFVTARLGWFVGAEPIGEMLFRVLKFRPPAPPEAVRPAAEPYPLRPAISQDTAFFWDGLVVGELRIQHCPGCGALRHPPGPFCPRCQHAEPDYQVAAGHGEIYSYVVHHHPPVPGRRAPFVVAVVALPEGVRMIGNVLADPADVRIGAPVEVEFERIDDDLVLPSWRLR
jgi:uncharacterized OB-fold protein